MIDTHVDYEKELNPEQLEVVMDGDGPALVIAGPGSGKTRTLVYRICRRLEQGGKPEGTLLLTFTNKAAREMKERAGTLIGEQAKKITAGTFHHFANILLRRHGELVGLESNFTILDEQDSAQVLRQAVINTIGKAVKGEVPAIMAAISLSRLRMVSLAELFEECEDFSSLEKRSEQVAQISEEYEKIKRKMNALDFDDLLVFADELLADDEIRERYNERFGDILVDEFQDADRLQASIINRVYRRGSNLMVVGDDSQSIYSFRGAEIRNILDFREMYGAKVFKLVRNYRSTAPIVNLVNHCIKNSRERLDKELVAIEKEGEPPLLIHSGNKAEEAWAIAERITEEMDGKRRFGVLFRAAYLASELEVELSRRGIEYEMRGGVRFFEQRHIKDMISVLKVYANARDSSGVMRLFTLFPGIGETRAARAQAGISSYEDAVSELAKLERDGAYSSMLGRIYGERKNAAGMLDAFYERFYRSYMEENFDDHEERKADVEALMGAAVKFETVDEFLASFSIDGEEPDEKDSQVVLSTIHQAKGLEWDSVFIMGMAEGMLPHKKAGNIEEERRLFYVAASRAKRSLVMSYPASGGRFYGIEEYEPSRFIQELPKDCYRRGNF